MRHKPSDEVPTAGTDTPADSQDASPSASPGRPAKRITMTDVARLAGCSQSTVSVVLNGTPGIRISERTRRRVKATVEELGYQYQRSKASRTVESRQIAIVFDQMATSPEAVVSFDGAREAAWQSGHVVSAFQTFNDPVMEPRTLKAVQNNHVTAIIYATIMTRKVTPPKPLLKAGIPVVLLNCYADHNPFPTVLPGEIAGGHRATHALITAGHRRIAHISGEMWMDAAKDRLEGYRQALATADIPYDPMLVREGNWQPSAGYEHTNALLDLERPPTAIFCANDRMAVGCYEALKERGLKIPRDISVIGYDDEEVAGHLTPQLTTLVLPHREMGRWAVEQILSAPTPATAETAGDRFPITKLECPLIERESIAPPHAG